MSIHDHILDDIDKASFTREYKESVFMLWYRSGKINSNMLYGLLPLSPDGRKPSKSTLKIWINDFKPRAEELDEVVKDELDGRLVQEKIEMLNRHAEIALEIQRKALDYLRNEEKSDLNSASAVRLLVEGIRIEKESRGIPKLLSKMASMTDDDLMKEAEKLLSRSPITEIKALDDGIVDYEHEDEELSDL